MHQIPEALFPFSVGGLIGYPTVRR